MASRPNRRILGIGELGQHLIVAFIGVVLATLLVDLIISSATVNTDLDRFSRAQEVNAAGTAAIVARTAFANGRWDREDLKPVVRAAAMSGASVQLLDTAGRQLVRSADFGQLPSGGQISRSLIVRGHRIGVLQVRFGPSGLRAAVAHLNAQRWWARIYAFIIALGLAVVVSVLITKRITAPLERLLAAVRARGAGDREARVADVSTVGVIRELSEAFDSASDALDERDKARRELIGNMAHELRTPVAILQAGTESMVDGISEPTLENLESLHDEVVRLTARLDDLQALARADSATLRLSLVHQNLAAIARDAADRLEDVYDVKGVSLQLQLEPVAIQCDYQRMIEVITNLLTNALKYTDPNGTVTIETGRVKDGQALLLVTDTGVGIPPDELPRVTERFFRGANSSSIASGSGIGLTIVAELVRAQHGTLDISSRPGSGTQVTITFPQASPRRLPRRRSVSRRLLGKSDKVRTSGRGAQFLAVAVSPSVTVTTPVEGDPKWEKLWLARTSH